MQNIFCLVSISLVFFFFLIGEIFASLSQLNEWRHFILFLSWDIILYYL